MQITIDGVTAEELKQKILALASMVSSGGAAIPAELGTNVPTTNPATATTEKKRGRPAKTEKTADAVATEAAAPAKPAVSLVPNETQIAAAQAAPAAQVVDPFDIAVGETTASSLTLNDCKQVMTEVNTKKGTQSAIQLLKTVGVNRLSELKPELFARFVDEAKKILAA